MKLPKAVATFAGCDRWPLWKVALSLAAIPPLYLAAWALLACDYVVRFLKWLHPAIYVVLLLVATITSFVLIVEYTRAYPTCVRNGGTVTHTCQPKTKCYSDGNCVISQECINTCAELPEAAP